ncbi:MAG TPA: C25 family cysteine peptidase [bacterium]|jgi:uncharacterized repeat protein (TIGR01451 family)
MRQASWFLLLGVILLPLLAFAAEAPEKILSTQILAASSHQTVVAADFDQAALHTRLSSMDMGDRPSDGLGTILAIAGHGRPVAHVQDYELGDAIQTTMSLAAQDIASSPEELVMLSEPAAFHDLRIVTLNYRALMRDASGTIRTVRRIRADVETTTGAGPNEINDPMTMSSAFYPLYRQLVANLDDLYPEVAQRTPGRFLVVAAQSRLDSMANLTYWQQWMDLKKRKGYQLQIVGLTNRSTDNVRSAIQAAYNDHSMRDLEYVMIIGDTLEMATFKLDNPEVGNESSVGDNGYYRLNGTDPLPDVLGGRVSGRFGAQYAAYFAKVVSYETNPYIDNTHWFQSMTCVAGNFATDGTYPVTPVWNVNWARDRMMRDNFITNADTFYYHNSIDDPHQYTVPIRQDIDSGVCAVIYRGWAGSQAWQYPIFGNNDASQLNNYRRTPAIFAIVCGSGNFGFDAGSCLGEMFTTGCGSVTQPKGGIIYIGASDLHTNTRHNNAILAGIVEGIMMGGIRSAGALLVAGKMEGWRQFPMERNNGNGQEHASGYYYIMHVFNLLGDPETQLYIGLPGTMAVTNPSNLTIGQTLVPITVTSGGNPVGNAMVTLRVAGSDEVQSARTDGGGHANLPANFSAAGTAQLTVWKSANFMQRIDIPIGATAFDPKVTGITWSDGGDNRPNPGETINYTLSVQNVGTSPATLTATVTSLDSRITVTSGSGTVSTLQPNESGTSTSLAIALSGELFNGEHPHLSVVLQDGSNSVTREIEVPIAAPQMVITSLRVADGGNGILEAGESNIPVYITATNVGGQAAANMTVTVSSWDNAISFPNGTANWTTLNVGDTLESGTAFNATVPSGVTPGRQITLRFEFRQNGVICAQAFYLLPTGVVTTHAPTGPDAYGYYAYEDIDNGFGATPTYNWVELDPARGGSGAVAHQVRDDTYFTMPLPAPFTYYGQAYDSVWVCSNGWFSFQQGPRLPEFRNWELPSPIGSPSLVAPLWTDLTGDRTMPNNDTLHYIWTRYDTNPNRFIIQWRTFLRAGLSGGHPDNDSCTFEAILEYPSSGDGSILLQYASVFFDNAGNDGNNYATVGWEDSYHERGMTLTFANVFPASVDTMRPGRAIRITTQAPDNFNAADPVVKPLPKQFALHEAYPNPFNPTTELQFDLPRAGNATLRVYDMLGRDVATLVDGHRAAGTYTVSFNATNLPSGLYFARLTAGSNTQVRKLMLIK